MLDTTVLPLFDATRVAPGSRESKDYTKHPKRDWGFLIFLSILFGVGIVIGSLAQNARYNAQHSMY
jgi:hypothetical protein